MLQQKRLVDKFHIYWDTLNVAVLYIVGVLCLYTYKHNSFEIHFNTGILRYRIIRIRPLLYSVQFILFIFKLLNVPKMY